MTSTISGFVLVFVFAFESVFILVCSHSDFAIAQEKKKKDDVPGEKVGCARNTDKYGQEWSNMGHGRIWTNMGKYGQIWANMDKYGQIWTNMDKYGQIWTNMDKYGQIWANMDKYGKCPNMDEC